MLSRVYLPTRSLVTKGQHTLAGHWLFPPSSSFPFTGEGPSLALCVLSLSVSLPLPPFFFLSLSRRRGSPVFHINTQIPWYRLGPARVYTGTTAAFHDTRPLSPPSSLHLCLSAASPSFRPPYPPVSPPTLPRAAGEAHLRDSLPLVALERPTARPLTPPRSFSCPTRLRSDGQPPFPFPSGSLISPFVHGATGCFRGSPVPFSPGSSPRASSSFSLVILLLGYYAPYFLLYILLQLSFIFLFLFDLFRSLHPFFSFYSILLNIFSSLYFR